MSNKEECKHSEKICQEVLDKLNDVLKENKCKFNICYAKDEIWYIALVVHNKFGFHISSDENGSFCIKE